jgi:hypothetical protein
MGEFKKGEGTPLEPRQEISPAPLFKSSFKQNKKPSSKGRRFLKLRGATLFPE